MSEKTSPTDVGAIKEKIDNGQVKVNKRGSKTAKTGATTKSKKHSVKGTKGKITDAKVIAYLKAQDKCVTSTQLRDNLHFKSRTQARRVLRRLEKAGKVVVNTRKISDKRNVFTFECA